MAARNHTKFTTIKSGWRWWKPTWHNCDGNGNRLHSQEIWRIWKSYSPLKWQFICMQYEWTIHLDEFWFQKNALLIYNFLKVTLIDINRFLFLQFWFSFFFVMMRCFQEISWPCHHQSFIHVWPIARQEDILKYYCIQPKNMSWPGVPEMSLYSYQSIIGEGYSVGFPTGKLFELSVLPSKSSAG